MSKQQSKQQFIANVDTHLLAQVDQLTGDRNTAIEEALRLWCEKKRLTLAPLAPLPPAQSIVPTQPAVERAPSKTEVEDILSRSAQQHRQRHDSDETGWLV